LQQQKKSFFAASGSTFIGVNADPLCDPSQKGCFALRPQAHQKYDLPASTSTPAGTRPATLASLTFAPSR
jgi:hypothetical protein